MKVLEETFYADYVMLASNYPGCLQTAFDTLTVIFDRVGLKMNVRKPVGVVYHP